MLANTRDDGPIFSQVIRRQAHVHIALCDEIERFREASATKDALARAEAAEAKVERLMEALRFYGDAAVYEPHPHGMAFDRRDLSHHARVALAEAEAGR